MTQSTLRKEDIGLTKEWREKTASGLIKKNIANPILQRLRSTISTNTGLVITSYDRMHHRHNRS